MNRLSDIVEALGMSVSEFAKHLRLDEETYKDLRRRAPHYLNIRDKSKKTPGSTYRGIEDDVIEFTTPSFTTPGVVYTQHIKLLDLNRLIQTESGTKLPKHIVRDAMMGDIEVHCTDPSWLYWGFKYIGTKDKYSIEPERRYPKVRNPNLEGSICKHLDSALLAMPFNISEVVRDLRQQKRL